ncbi:bifunctional diaminohydroxyphosphoribosylaminopyrimidine deaminase/5-amino-6-(5-phosphoribosylamino)uracil reductase RibD [Desulfosporosinus shakirovi]|uniref:bifunctional diaminohydroxyphosphoribosylaminopyrimidine deaminase/5-amino-6-(5-phosphoribosylamino)uracil reductase RibD n=1 Tax=Desulfosporosinus shakirovi TaxID=2885154 RepID=UPI001E2B8BEB|nr:bifunctional diaminohydroxyphosphoribosylaminopyrimidine deaminase/5-amino-6-(5-phosphoribosylamino)uracil reductase RibD [Desulfosporosinus sp. SRJS8]MCB8816376.1 bifunctional diaminohydroxyphosphoribosylaminopyrimidine deaminase/5-amino-6-(5-phosphoribosylamino)uracil reductase RibD [Desulfosporosinus sp. SRJS8]
MHKSSPSDLNDEQFMKRALDLAAMALGRTSPNPLVGCVIVKNDKILGEGFHHKAGTPHAEIHALTAAGDQAQGATAYVTLEPCSHFGRTPPCADALIRAKLRRVVVAMKDPNPLVAGRGLERLLQAGIQVDVGLFLKEALLLNETFIKSITAGLPFVVYKSAMTLDGKIATETGDSQWISNEISRQYVHQLRDRYDVILVGSQTVLQDNPALTCRLPSGKDPIRLIVDGKLVIDEHAQVLTSSKSSPCIIATSLSASREKVERLRSLHQVEVWQYNTERYVPLEKLMRDLVQRGWISVLLEGGGGLAGALLQEKLVDKAEFFIAPKLVGGKGPSPLSGLHIGRMADAIGLDNLCIDMKTGDLHVTGYIHPKGLD